MAAVRDLSVTRYLNLQSGKDMLEGGALNNFRVAISQDVATQTVRAVQLLNTSFIPIRENVPLGSNYIELDQTHDFVLNQVVPMTTPWEVQFTDPSQGPPVQFQIHLPHLQAGWSLWDISRFGSPGLGLSEQVTFGIQNSGRVGDVTFQALGPGDRPYPGWRVHWDGGIGPNASLLFGPPNTATPAEIDVFRKFFGTINTHFDFSRVGNTWTSDLQASGWWSESVVRTRYTVPPGAYTYQDLATALQASSATRTPLLGPRYQTSNITTAIDGNGILKIIATQAPSPGLGPDGGLPPYAYFRVVLDSPLAQTLGFVQNVNPALPQYELNTDQSNNGQPALNGDMRCFLHVRPANESGGMVIANGIPRRIAAWAAIDLTKTPEGAAVFQDFTYSGDSAYYVGFLNNRDCTIMDFSLRYIDGRPVQVLHPGVEVSLKLLIDQV